MIHVIVQGDKFSAYSDELPAAIVEEADTAEDAVNKLLDERIQIYGHPSGWQRLRDILANCKFSIEV